MLTELQIIWSFYPETKNRSLEDMDVLFDRHYTSQVGFSRTSNNHDEETVTLPKAAGQPTVSGGSQ